MCAGMSTSASARWCSIRMTYLRSQVGSLPSDRRGMCSTVLTAVPKTIQPKRKATRMETAFLRVFIMGTTAVSVHVCSTNRRYFSSQGDTITDQRRETLEQGAQTLTADNRAINGFYSLLMLPDCSWNVTFDCVHKRAKLDCQHRSTSCKNACVQTKSR